jgi:hypothetical protein
MAQSSPIFILSQNLFFLLTDSSVEWLLLLGIHRARLPVTTRFKPPVSDSTLSFLL